MASALVAKLAVSTSNLDIVLCLGWEGSESKRGFLREIFESLELSLLLLEELQQQQQHFGQLPME
tara:strand:- start:31 stop:225 length:195 start_codon:yes stop_codon:yes gene_type:complete